MNSLFFLIPSNRFSIYHNIAKNKTFICLIFCNSLPFLALIQKEETMKSNTSIIIPDSLFEALGFTLPFSKNEPEYVKGESVTSFLGTQRINTLKRESQYRTYYPELTSINLLTLNYPSIPKSIYERSSYIKKIIRKNILKTLYKLSPDKQINQDCQKYIKSILSIYGDNILVSVQQRESNPFANIASQILQSHELLCLSFLSKQGESIYTDPFSKKPKDGHYYMKIDPERIVCIIDLPNFLADILLLQTIHYIQTDINLSLIQNIFDSFIQLHSQPESSCSFKECQEINQFICSLKSKTLLPENFLFHNYSFRNKDYFKPGLSSIILTKLIELFCNILEIYQDIQYENRYRDKMDKTIATAYITKKNIPQKVLTAMEHTSFKKYFKYVEFDEEVNLNSVKIIEKEFSILNEAYFSSKAFFNVTLRFRKLGKHKASGLYYPNLHTLCVDLRSPSSFIHEYFHMLDDQLGDLSLEIGFQDIVHEYKRALLHEITHLEPAIQHQLNGTSKYNLQYFFRRAEIFARCGEIYFVRILKVESSLIKPDLEYAYPKSELLDTLIKNYYSTLLNVRLKQSDFSTAV